MNIMKIALLGTAAIAAVSVSARADNLSDLKAQIETLNARVASLETAPAVPAGYSMVGFSQDAALVVPSMTPRRGDNATAHFITIMPTADAPAAPATVVTWSGAVIGALVYDTVVYNSLDVVAQARLHVSGKTDTAVGEVGVDIGLQANNSTLGTGGAALPLLFAGNRGNNGAVSTDGYWGYWKMTPELSLGAGFGGSLSGIGYGYDGACTCKFTDFADAGYGLNDAAQMRLSYASGPMSAAIAIEDGGNVIAGGQSGFGVAGEIKYAGDMVSGEVSGGWLSKVGTTNINDRWVVGAGLGFKLGDMAKLSMAAGVGAKGAVAGDDFWKASILANLSLSDQAHAEIAFNHADYTLATLDQNSVLAGVYYDPVKQLTIGVEGEWAGNPNAANAADGMRADLVTVFRF